MARTIRKYDKKKHASKKVYEEQLFEVCEFCGIELNEQEKDLGLCQNCFKEIKNGK